MTKQVHPSAQCPDDREQLGMLYAGKNIWKLKPIGPFGYCFKCGKIYRVRWGPPAVEIHPTNTSILEREKSK